MFQTRIASILQSGSAQGQLSLPRDTFGSHALGLPEKRCPELATLDNGAAACFLL